MKADEHPGIEAEPNVFSRKYTSILEISGHVQELIACLCDPKPSDEQLVLAQESLKAVGTVLANMDHLDDGYPEISAIVSRLDKLLVRIRRFTGQFDERSHRVVDHALHMLDAVVQSRLSDREGESNVRQCIQSLDALLARPIAGRGDRARKVAFRNVRRRTWR